MIMKRRNSYHIKTDTVTENECAVSSNLDPVKHDKPLQVVNTETPAGDPYVKLEGDGFASGGLWKLKPCIARIAVGQLLLKWMGFSWNAPVDGPTQWRQNSEKQIKRP
nr:hypothetical protein [Tanacetum cinerariifolium]